MTPAKATQPLRDAVILIVQGTAQINGRSVTLRVERLSGMGAALLKAASD